MNCTPSSELKYNDEDKWREFKTATNLSFEVAHSDNMVVRFMLNNHGGEHLYYFQNESDESWRMV